MSEHDLGEPCDLPTHHDDTVNEIVQPQRKDCRLCGCELVMRWPLDQPWNRRMTCGCR